MNYFLQYAIMDQNELIFTFLKMSVNTKKMKNIIISGDRVCKESCNEWNSLYNKYSFEKMGINRWFDATWIFCKHRFSIHSQVALW